MKMKQYFEPLPKRAPAPKWIDEGLPYSGE